MERDASHTADWAAGSALDAISGIPPVAPTTPGECRKEVVPLNLEI